ncbi:MAG: GGDEF domain-containing protein [Rubrivivax sp.]|nr:GGDEF domain-containing protein [Rubrivivax sp.]MCW5634782.1 GGDEF domain-containing protein [Rubrivivax sp.]
MNQAQIVLTLILLQQGLAVFAWWGAARLLRVSRVSALHWAAASAVITLTLVLYALIGLVPGVLAHGLSNALVPLAFVLLRRGVQRFVRLRYSDLEHQALVLVSAVVIAAGWQAGAPESLPILVATAVPAWCLLRMAVESHASLQAEFGASAARVFGGAIGLLGLLFALRFVAGLAWPELAARPVGVDTPLNTLLVMSFMVIGLMLQMVLGLLVVMRLAQRLSHLSRHDSLTGLPNRRVMQDAITTARLRHLRRGTPYALLAVDVDHFKRVNDEHGHAVGDEALVHVARALRESLRSDDCVARMGGEEFCALLGDCDRDEALAHAERLRGAVAATPLRLADGRPLRLTVSVGVALAADAVEPRALLEQADGALYAAKDAGRNRVVLHAA